MLGISASIMTIALVYAFGVQIAKAQPTYIGLTVQTATATTSVRYLTPGTGTTTLTYDAYVPTTNSYTPAFATLLIQFAGSSTASTLGINIEYSQDGIDWYKSSTLSPFSPGTTTNAVNLGATNSYTWTFASSTVGGTGVTAATGATSTRAIMLSTPLRYVRSVVSITGAGGAVWQQIVPTKELRY